MLKSFIVCLCITLFSACSMWPWSKKESDGNSKLAPLAKVVTQLSKPLVACPNRLWSGLDWPGIIIIYDDSIGAIKWKPGGEISEISLNDVPQRGMWPSDWWSAGFNGQQAIVIKYNTSYKPNPNDNQQASTVRLALHEGFHVFGQTSVVLEDNVTVVSGGPGTKWRAKAANPRYQSRDLYPTISKPRYLRAEIGRNLLTAFLQDDSDALGKAAYWQSLYSQNYAEDEGSLSEVDRIEGSATFAEIIGSIISKEGCGISDKNLAKKIKAAVKEESSGGETTAFKPDSFSRFTEGYTIGALALFLLQQKNIANWQSRVTNGETPEKVLFESVTPITADEDSDFLAISDEVAAGTNAALDEYLKTDLEKFRSTDYVKFAFPLTSLTTQSGYGTSSQIISIATTDSNDLVYNTYATAFIRSSLEFSVPHSNPLAHDYSTLDAIDAPDATGSITNSTFFVVLGGVNPCKENGVGYFVVPLKASDFTIQSVLERTWDANFETMKPFSSKAIDINTTVLSYIGRIYTLSGTHTFAFGHEWWCADERNTSLTNPWPY